MAVVSTSSTAAKWEAAPVTVGRFSAACGRPARPSACTGAFVKRWSAATAIALMPCFADADGCQRAAQAVADATGATLGQRSIGNQVYVQLTHPNAVDLAVHCKSLDPRRGPEIFIATQSRRPSPAFFALAATAASALLLLRPEPMRKAAQRCLAAALLDEAESSSLETKELLVVCTINKEADRATLTIGSAMMRPY